MVSAISRAARIGIVSPRRAPISPVSRRGMAPAVPGQEGAMERSGATPQVAADTSDLVDLAKAVGPFLTLQLTTEAGIDNAAQRSEQRWRAVRDHAAAQGAPTEVLDAVDPIVADAHLDGQGLAVIASAGGVLHTEHSSQLPDRDLARWAPLPSLLPVVAWRQMSPPYVTVLADRAGADLTAYGSQGPSGPGSGMAGPELHREAGGAD